MLYENYCLILCINSVWLDSWCWCWWMMFRMWIICFGGFCVGWGRWGGYWLFCFFVLWWWRCFCVILWSNIWIVLMFGWLILGCWIFVIYWCWFVRLWMWLGFCVNLRCKIFFVLIFKFDKYNIKNWILE